MISITSSLIMSLLKRAEFMVAEPRKIRIMKIGIAARNEPTNISLNRVRTANKTEIRKAGRKMAETR